VVHDLSRPVLPDELPSRIDVVIHLAQAREFRDFPSRALDVFAVNVASTALLADWACAVGARQFMVASTGGVYQPSSAPHREDEAISGSAAPSFYAASKLAAESLARAYSAYLTVTVFRPFFIYGRGQDATMLFPRLIDSIRSGRPIHLDGPDGMRFNPIHVSDACRAVSAALAIEDSCVVNLAGPEVLSLRRAVGLLSGAIGVEPALDREVGAAPTDLIGDISTMAARVGPPIRALADTVAELCR
ncbi:MAG: NAD-dependent epimerase/dehydratase family protein, partial [Acidimicrobiales bacterium]